MTDSLRPKDSYAAVRVHSNGVYGNGVHGNGGCLEITYHSIICS